MSVTPIDIRMDVAFLRNLKTRKLVAALGSDGVVSLIRLWCYTRERHPQGVLDGVGLGDLEVIASWPGKPGAFAEYATSKRWVDVSPEGVLSIHDWPEHQPWAFGSKRRSEAAKIGAHSKWQNVGIKRDSARRIRGASKPHTNRNAAELSTGAETPVLGGDAPGKDPLATPRIDTSLCEPHTNRYAPSPTPTPFKDKDLPPASGTAGPPEGAAVPPTATRPKDACAFIGGCNRRGTIKGSDGKWYCTPHGPDQDQGILSAIGHPQ